MVEMFVETSLGQEDLCKENTMKDQRMDVRIPKMEPPDPIDNSSEDFANLDRILNSPIPFTIPYKVKDPIVLVERCDKIWNTLKLIKEAQNTDEMEDNASAESVNETTEAEHSYIKYQPVLGNNNTALPNFKFSVKATKKLYTCLTCGKQYTENRSLRHHSERIHGIFIPLKRINKRTTVMLSQPKSKEREGLQGIEKKRTNLEESEHPEKFEVQLSRRGRSRSTCNGIANEATINPPTNKSSHKETQESQRKNVAQTRKQDERAGDSTQICILCNQNVKDMKSHLTDYHKIGCAENMLKKMEWTSSSETLVLQSPIVSPRTVTKNDQVAEEKIATVAQKVDSSTAFQNVAQDDMTGTRKRKFGESLVNPKRKYKLNNTDDSSDYSHPHKKLRQCDICLGMYSGPCGLYKHKRQHRFRGETKENFHLVKCRYHNSPFSNLRRSGPTPSIPAIVTPSDAGSNLCPDKTTNEEAIDTANDIEDNKQVSTCNCGRSFRNPHTLFIHKRKCKLEDAQQGEAADNNNCDDDLEVGISITIKKKNDSYEIVGRDSGDEDKSKDSGHPKSGQSDISSDISDNVSVDCRNGLKENDQLDVSQTSKYSKNHSILKLQEVDEDIVVDIEEDSQNHFLAQDINRKCVTSTLQSDVKQETTNILKTYENGNDQEVPSLKFLSTEIHNTDQPEEDMKYLRFPHKRTCCWCGKRFETRRARNVHVTKYHKLMCGHCGDKFAKDLASNDLECGEKQDLFTGQVTYVHCPYCAIRLPSKEIFDEHINLEHNNRILPFQCYKCLQRFRNDVIREFHFKNKHSMWKCYICCQMCYVSVKLKQKAYHKGVIVCDVCNRAFPTSRILNYHKRYVHQNIKETVIRENITGEINTYNEPVH